ncbi:hypothetical protein EG832_07205 [bacterium]|nr:hypothetical protein [bacterium]
MLRNKIAISITGIEQLHGIPWEEFRYDNDKANLSNDVQRVLLQDLGCRINEGPVAFPEVRALIERFFQTLEQCGFRQLPGNLGTGPHDTNREGYENAVKAYRLSYDDLLLALDESIKWYNLHPRHRNFYNSPLSVLQSYCNNDDNIVIHVPEEKLNKIQNLGIKYTKIVRGNKTKGVRPHINFYNADYFGDSMNTRWDLLGEKISCIVQEDARRIMAYLDDGRFLGQLKILTGPWSEFPHTIEVRILVQKGKIRQTENIVNNSYPGVQINMAIKQRRKLSKKDARNALIVQQGGNISFPTVSDLSEQTNEYNEPDPDESLEDAYKRKGVIID